MSHRRTLGALLVLTVPVVAACGAGRTTETDRERSTPYVASANAGPVAVRAVRVVVADSTTASAAPTPSASTTASASATPSASPAAGSPSPSAGGAQAYLVATMVNRAGTADALTNATVRGGAVQPTGADSSSLSLPSGQLVHFGDPDQGATGATLAIGALTTPLLPGTTTTVTFTFQNAGTVRLEVPVTTSADLGTTASAMPVSAAG